MENKIQMYAGKTALVLVLALILIISNSYAADFNVDLSINPDKISLCPCDTSQSMLIVENTGKLTDYYTISFSGAGSEWLALSRPSGFKLNPGETREFAIWTTPQCTVAKAGVYDVKVTVSSSQVTKSKSLKLDVMKCRDLKISADNAQISTCQCTKGMFVISVLNNGKYAEDFGLTLEGPDKNLFTLNQNSIKVQPGKDGSVIVYASAPCDGSGMREVTLLARTGESQQQDRLEGSVKLKMDVKECFASQVNSQKNIVSMCDFTKEIIPITILNQGTIGQEFKITSIGPSWAAVETNKMILSAGESKQVNLILNPGYKVSGKFTVKVQAVGKETREINIEVNVNECHKTDVAVLPAEDSICACDKKVYTVSLANTGKYGESYNLNVAGPTWAKLDKYNIGLDKQEATTANLIVDVPCNPDKNDYSITVGAHSVYACNTSDSSILNLHIKDVKTCYGMDVNLDKKVLDIKSCEPITVSITVKNTGIENKTYLIAKTGTGAAMTSVNPSKLTLSPGQSDTLNVYISVPNTVAEGRYYTTLGVQTEDGLVTKTETITMNVVREKADETQDGIGNQTSDLGNITLSALATLGQNKIIWGLFALTAIVIIALVLISRIWKKE